MIIIYGTHRFGKKLIEEKTVTCKTCEKEVAARKESTFDMIHLFFVPLIPLGRHERWHCPSCGEDPFVPNQSKFIRVVLVLIVLATVVWSFLAHPSKIDIESLWIIRGLLTLIFLGVLYWAARPFRSQETAEQPPETS